MLPQKGRVALGATLAVLSCGMAGAHAQDDTDALRAQIEALRSAIVRARVCSSLACIWLSFGSNVSDGRVSMQVRDRTTLQNLRTNSI